MEPLPEAVKTEENRIHGCASKLWIIGGADSDEKMQYKVDGDAFITKGTAKVLEQNGMRCKKINKVSSGKPHIVDILNSNKIS